MLTDLAEDAAMSGWHATVMTSDSLRNRTSPRLPRQEVRNGVTIVRIRTPRFERFGLLGRAADSIAFVLGVVRRLLLGRRHDVVVALTDPPLIVALTVMISRARRMRTIYWIHDLFPQIAGALGVLKINGITYRILNGIARAATARCDLVIALGEYMSRRAIEAGASAGRITVVPNWADTTSIRPLAQSESRLTNSLRVKGKFVVLYSGNVGRAHTFGSTIEAARRLIDQPDIVFLFIGRGPRLSELTFAAAQGVKNLRFAEPVARDQLVEALATGSVSLVTEDPRVAGLVVPSKTYGILASGRPIVFIGSRESDVASLVRRHNCGAVLADNDIDGLVAVLRAWYNNPDEVAVLGRNARAAASHYSRGICTLRWLQAAESLVARPA
jgi:glycosyltransferase involved in cell wall biosynthesis